MAEWIGKILRDLFGYLGQNWEPLVAYATLVAAIVGYFLSRRRELAWKRTEFLFLQSQYIDKDTDMSEVIQILEDRHPTLTVEGVFGEASDVELPVRNASKHKFDKLLGHIDLIAYAVLYVRTLSLTEAESFGWYIERIVRSSLLRNYCAENGHQDLLTLAGKLKLLPGEEVDGPRASVADRAASNHADSGRSHVA